MYLPRNDSAYDAQSGEHGKGSNAFAPDFLLTTGAVLGCGTVPGGPAASRTWRFNVTGFSLPVAMAFSTDAAARAQVPQISPNSGSAEAFVKRLIIQGVLDVLEQQGRAAGLPDFVITTIWVSSVSTSSTHHYHVLRFLLTHRMTSNFIMANWGREMWQSVSEQSASNDYNGVLRNALCRGCCHRH
ncbi:hypothetical protein KIN20_014249 [Parelaphostrongylus tenuis]|uniref:Uncharacterized protein n=1 Tax=Parelaphostrongylus tenuis TaxID=148309 RepID=A0AAD5QLI5_PARTN|nr:hypothetical protein KIN20_014249 [Parelaphostrongylus tenuis]